MAVTRTRRWSASIGAVLMAASLLAVPRPAAAGAGSDTVALVGDSIGRDAEPQVRALVEPEHAFAHYEAVAAGSIPYHQPTLTNVVSAPDGPDIVILELGTGDAFYEAGEANFEAHARSLLDAITPHVDCIRWLDIKNGGTRAYPSVNRYAAGVNRVIHRVANDYPNVEYVDYEVWTRLADSSYFHPDLLHHTAKGKVALARMIDQAVDGCDPGLASGPFWDVRDDYWAADDIAWMDASGVANGYPNGTYRATLGGIQPTVTRAQMANFLWRMEGSPDGHPDHPWTDGPIWIEDALDWLAATGVANGYPDNTFRPEQPVSRGEIANFLWNLAGRPTDDPDHPWTDGPPWLKDALDWMAANGVADGFPDGTFRPGGPLTRAAMAHLLHEYDSIPPDLPILAESDEVGPPPTTQARPSTTTTSPTTTPPPTTTTPSSTTTAPPPTVIAPAD